MENKMKDVYDPKLNCNICNRPATEDRRIHDTYGYCEDCWFLIRPLLHEPPDYTSLNRITPNLFKIKSFKDFYAIMDGMKKIIKLKKIYEK